MPINVFNSSNFCNEKTSRQLKEKLPPAKPIEACLRLIQMLVHARSSKLRNLTAEVSDGVKSEKARNLMRQCEGHCA